MCNKVLASGKLSIFKFYMKFTDHETPKNKKINGLVTK